MNQRITFSILAAIMLVASSFRQATEVDRCFLSMRSINGLKPRSPDRLPERSRGSRRVETEDGNVGISCMDGYRILYNNSLGAPFVNVKVELSADGAYGEDTANNLKHLSYLAGRSSGFESQQLQALSYNGYRISGFSRSQIDSGMYLGTYVMFPGDGVTVYFYFQNIRKDYRNFNSVSDYQSQRNAFLGEYTARLRRCVRK